MTDTASPISVDRARSEIVSTTLAAAVLLGGLLVIAGWALHVPALKGVRPGLVEMKINTAVGFAATGAAILLVGGTGVGKTRKRLGLALAGFVALLGTLTLAEYLLKVDLGIDQLLARDDPGDTGTSSPGRMAFVTCVGFILSGMAVTTLDRCRGGRSWPLNFTTSAILALSIPSLVGYVYGIRRLYGVAGSTEMALHTAGLFILIAAAVMAACPGVGLAGILTSGQAGGYFARRVLPAAVFIPVTLGAVLAVGRDFGTGDTAYAATLAAVFFLIAFVGFLWFTATALNRVDQRRIRFEREIAARVERDRAADQIRESEKRFRELADAMPQLVWSCTADGQCDYWNRRTASYLGKPVPDLLGRRWVDCLHPDDVDRTLKAWQQAVRTGEPYDVEFRMRLADGSYRWQLARGLPSFEPGGRVTRWFGTCTDIDDQRRMMDALQQADRIKDQFLATISHELRTPLTSILGWSTLLREHNPTSETLAEAIEAIHRNTVAQTRLVEALLDSSRIVLGKMRIDARPMDLGPVVTDAVRTAARAVLDRVVEVDLTVTPTPLWINGDADRCRQVVINLVNNAIKFGDPGGRPSVTLAADRNAAVLTVSNTGQGISPEFLPHVFDQFRQQDGSMTRRHSGLGLGMSIAKNLVDLHGGIIEAASDGPGKGARFTARFPTIPKPAA